MNNLDDMLAAQRQQLSDDGDRYAGSGCALWTVIAAATVVVLLCTLIGAAGLLLVANT